MSRIAGCFAALKETNKTALIPFITAGDPQREVTVPLMHTLDSTLLCSTLLYSTPLYSTLL